MSSNRFTIRQLIEADEILKERIGNPLTTEEERETALAQMDVIRQSREDIAYLLDETIDHTATGQQVLSNAYRIEMNEILEERQREAAESRTFGEKISDIGDKLLGGADAALTLGTGMTTGALGLTVGFIKGVYDNLVDDDAFTSKESQQDIENTMIKYMQTGTFSPRTEEGKEFVQAIGRFLEPLQALAPTVTTPLAGVGTQVAGMTGRAANRASQAAQSFKNVDALEVAKQQAKGGNVKSEWVTLAAQTDPKIVKAADRLGILDHLQADHVTTNQMFREVAQISKELPGSRAGVAEKVGLEQISQRVDDLVKTLGGDDLSTVNVNVKTLLEDDLAVLGREASDLYSQVDKLVPRQTPINVNTFNQFFQEEVAAVGGISGVDPQLVKLNKLLNPKTGEKLTYARLDRVRKELNQGIQDKGQFSGISSSNAKRYSAILSEAQKEAADSVNPEAGKLFQQANAISQARMSVRDDLTSLFGANLDREIVQPLISGVKDLQKGSISKLQNLLERTPESMRNEVLISGLATGMKTNAKNNKPISFTNFVQLFDGISRNKEARKLVLGNLKPEQRKAVMDLYRVSRGISKSLDAKIKTGRLGYGETSQQLQAAAAENIMMSVLKIPQRTAAKTVTKVIPETSGATYQYLKEMADGRSKQVGNVVNDVIGSREFLNVVRSVGTAREGQAILEFTNLPFFKKFKNDLKDPELYIRNAIYASANKEQEEEEKQKQ